MVAIRIQDLHKAFGQVRALDGLTLSVERGSVFGFLGPNGAGKTTTLRILTGLAQATGGRARINDIEVTTQRNQVARRIGYLPQEPAFYPWMTGREFLDHVGRVFDMPTTERRTRTQELLERMGLNEAADRRIGGYSGGMKQRLGVAQALINRPSVLLLDEPVSSLDPAGRKKLLEMIERLRGQCTVFMSTHILADVERICDTVGIIHRGKMIAHSPKDELLAHYAIPAFEIETESDQAAQRGAWTKTLQHAPWVTSVIAEERTTRVVVNDVAAAKSNLLALAIQAGLVLTRYEMVRPSLEDVFLQLIGQGETE